jgi:hypothetical protein
MVSEPTEAILTPLVLFDADAVVDAVVASGTASVPVAATASVMSLAFLPNLNKSSSRVMSV